jgi:hypothetical protein
MGLPVIHPVGHGSHTPNRDLYGINNGPDALTHHNSPTTTNSRSTYNDCGCQSFRPSRLMVAALNLQVPQPVLNHNRRNARVKRQTGTPRLEEEVHSAVQGSDERRAERSRTAFWVVIKERLF